MASIEGVQAPRTLLGAARRAKRSMACAALVAVTVALALGWSTRATAQSEGDGRVCNDGTLRGDYGFLVTGFRGSEPFVKIGMRTYDGYGGLVDVGSSHGQVTPPLRNTQLVGTYHVNPDRHGNVDRLPSGQPPAGRERLRDREPGKDRQGGGDAAPAEHHFGGSREEVTR